MAIMTLVSSIRMSNETTRQIVTACELERSDCDAGISALGFAGTHEAQVALVQLFKWSEARKLRDDSARAANTRRGIIRALGTRLAGVPTQRTLDTIMGALNDPTVGSRRCMALERLPARSTRRAIMFALEWF